MEKNWTKKCTCENFQQNEDCEHIGNKVLEEVGLTEGALTPLGELVEAIQVFRNTMAQDRCYGHCKTYQEEIQKLSDIAYKVKNI